MRIPFSTTRSSVRRPRFSEDLPCRRNMRVNALFLSGRCRSDRRTLVWGWGRRHATQSKFLLHANEPYTAGPRPPPRPSPASHPDNRVGTSLLQEADGLRQLGVLHPVDVSAELVALVHVGLARVVEICRNETGVVRVGRWSVGGAGGKGVVLGDGQKSTGEVDRSAAWLEPLLQHGPGRRQRRNKGCGMSTVVDTEYCITLPAMCGEYPRCVESTSTVLLGCACC